MPRRSPSVPPGPPSAAGDRQVSAALGAAAAAGKTRDRAALRVAQAAATGSVCGLAWAGALRAYMAELNSALSTVTWSGTFVGVLLPGLIAGGLLGVASAIRPTPRGRQALRWCAAAPLAFAIVPMLLPGQLGALLTTGLGGGAVGVALGGLGAGYALGGRRLWLRLLAGVIGLTVTVGVSASVPSVGGPQLAASEPRGLWIMALAASLMIVFGLAAAIPFRRLNAAAVGAPTAWG